MLVLTHARVRAYPCLRPCPPNLARKTCVFPALSPKLFVLLSP